MKKYLVTALLVWAILWQPSPISNGQSNQTVKNQSVLDVLEAKKQTLFNKAFANQDTVADLAKKKPKTIIVEKIRYIKVYKTVPIYVEEKDSLAYQETFPKDTVENDYFIAPPRAVTPDKQPKRSFLYKLFHHKK